MTLPVKPEVTIVNNQLAVFMGADYKMMPLAVADKHVRALQGKLAGRAEGESMTELSPKQIQALDTAVLRIVDADLHKLIPDRQREVQALQRSHVWVKRELKSRKGERG